MVLRLVFEGVGHLDALVAIATGNAVADEFYAAFGQCRSIKQLTVLVKHKATKVWFQLVALNDIHDTYQVLTLRQGDSQRGHRVALTAEGHLERFCLVNTHHEVAALGLAQHLQRRAGEAGVNLHTRESEPWLLGVVEANTAHILNVGVICRNHFSLYGQGG